MPIIIIHISLYSTLSLLPAMLQTDGRPLQHLHPMTLGRTLHWDLGQLGHISLVIRHITIIIVSTRDESRNHTHTTRSSLRAQLTSVEPGDLP